MYLHFSDISLSVNEPKSLDATLVTVVNAFDDI